MPLDCVAASYVPLTGLPIASVHVPPLCGEPPKELNRLMGEAVLQMLTLPLEPALGGALTTKVVVPEVAHCPDAGLKVRVIVPLNPLGLKVLPPVTPLPAHVPVKPPWVVFKVIAEPLEHWLPGDRGTAAVAGLTLIVVVDGNAH